LTGDVELTVEGNKLIIHSAHSPRQGWEAQFAVMAEQADDQLLDEAAPTQRGGEEWAW
jgi:hypothetical protein